MEWWNGGKTYYELRVASSTFKKEAFEDVAKLFKKLRITF
jgi:hypothetical protein